MTQNGDHVRLIKYDRGVTKVLWYPKLLKKKKKKEYLYNIILPLHI